jgi:glycosyltransferase involved in cell wall biosynthesis
LHLRTVTGHGGGPEKTILNSPRFISSDYKLEIAYIRPTVDADYDLPRRAKALGIDLIDIPERNGFDVRTLFRLSSVIRKVRPDILHAHDYKTNVLAVLLGKLHRVRVMTTVHGYVTVGPKLNFYYRVDRWALRRMDYVVAVSEDLFAALKAWNIPESRRSVVVNAIDSEQYQRRILPSEAKGKLGFNPDRLLIGAVGRLSVEKGFDQLITVADRLMRAGLNIDLIIVGDGEERDRLQNMIRTLGCTDRIQLLGHRSDTIELYEAMDIFVLSSLREALPNVVLEALAMEVPLVATRVAGVPQVIEHDSNGLLIAPGNIDELSTSLAQLAVDPELRQRLRANGRRTVEDRYSFSVRMEKIKSIYDRVLNRAAGVQQKPLAVEAVG